jgi:hypothetical protein
VRVPWEAAPATLIFFTALATQIATRYAKGVLRSHRGLDNNYPADLHQAINRRCDRGPNDCDTAIESFLSQLIAIWALLWLNVSYAIILAIQGLFWGEKLKVGWAVAVLIALMMFILIALKWLEGASIEPYMGWRRFFPPLFNRLTFTRVALGVLYCVLVFAAAYTAELPSSRTDAMNPPKQIIQPVIKAGPQTKGSASVRPMQDKSAGKQR